jgi:hypothetical protein
VRDPTPRICTVFEYYFHGVRSYQDLFMLRDADYFVGTFASQFSRLAFEMNAAHKGGVVRASIPNTCTVYPYCCDAVNRYRISALTIPGAFTSWNRVTFRVLE